MRLAFDFAILSFLLAFEFTAGHVFNAACMLFCYATLYSVFDLGRPKTKI
jgi:hypothetical protein